MLIPITAKCQYSGKPEHLLVPEARIVTINTATAKATFKDDDRLRSGELDFADLYRLQVERIPAPAGITLHGRPVLYVTLDASQNDASVATLGEDGSIVVSEVYVRLDFVHDREMAEQAAEGATAEEVVEKVLASKPSKKCGGNAAGGGGTR